MENKIFECLLECQKMVTSGASFKSVMAFVRIARDVYGKEQVARCMRMFGMPQLVSLMD